MPRNISSDEEVAMLFSRHTTRRTFISILGVATAAWPFDVRAQHPDRPEALPGGVMLEAIDGETMLTSKTMSNNYFARNGFTYAANAGWDNPNFFPIGPWAAKISSSADLIHWQRLGWNTAYVIGSSPIPRHAQALFKQHAIWVVMTASPFAGQNFPYWPSPGSETVGILTYDEPQSGTEFYRGMSTAPNSFQDGRFWWVNNTGAWIVYGSPANSGQQASWLAAEQRTPNGGTRQIDISSIDFYPFTRNDEYGPPSVSNTWGLSSTATEDQYRRGFFYGDVIDAQRLYTRGSKPLIAIIESGGPFPTDKIASDYIQPEEMNWAAWQSIIHGARALIYFNHSFGGPGRSDDNMGSPYFQFPRSVATFSGTGSGRELTVSEVTGRIFLNNVISGTGVPVGTTIIKQKSGTEGRAGVYTTSQAITAKDTTFTATQSISIYEQTAKTNWLVKSLAPIINSPNAKGYVTVNPPSGEIQPLPLAIGKGVLAFSGIDIMAKWYQGGGSWAKGFYIFASTRMSPSQTKIAAIFTINDPDATHVKELTSNTSINIDQITRTFEYVFPNAWACPIFLVNG